MLVRYGWKGLINYLCSRNGIRLVSIYVLITYGNLTSFFSGKGVLSTPQETKGIVE